MIGKRSILVVSIGLAGIGTVLVGRRRQEAARLLRRERRRLERQAHHLAGQVRGIDYRLHGRHPDEGVSDQVLADRIRSAIGPLVHRLDLPHPHVMVNDHVATLHGDVATEYDAQRLSGAVLDVPGVRAVRSYLHVGLLPSDTRPSDGRDGPHHPSPALAELLAAARDAGAGEAPLHAVRAVLGTFFERLPTGERAHVMAHLPEDVRRVAVPPSLSGREVGRLRTAVGLYAGVVAVDSSVDDEHVHDVIDAVLGCLATLVPEECGDVAAVLPDELGELWQRAAAAKPLTDQTTGR
jgi:uncharacterized protein (DUF2267 family)